MKIKVMQNILLTSVALEKLRAELTDPIIKEITHLKELLPIKEQPELLTRKEAAKFLSISLPTLLEWTKSGQIQGYRISSRIRYKLSELEGCLTKIKTFK